MQIWKKKKCYSKEIFSLSKILLQIEKQKNKKQKNICKLKHSIKFIRRIKLSNIWYFYLKKRNTDDKNKRKTKKKKKIQQRSVFERSLKLKFLQQRAATSWWPGCFRFHNRPSPTCTFHFFVESDPCRHKGKRPKDRLPPNGRTW